MHWYEWAFSGIGMLILSYLIQHWARTGKASKAILTAQGAPVINSPVAGGSAITQMANSAVSVHLNVGQPVKTEVRFSISNPIAFTSEEDYSQLGIEASIVEGKLVALKTVVEHDIGAGHDNIISKAWSVITSLLTLIEFGYGCPLNIGGVQTHTIEPASEVSIGLGFVKVAATLVRPVPMPPVETVANLDEITRLQLNWHLLGQNGSSVIERIKNYYKVLEQEELLTEKSASPYVPPAETRHLRNAVSHPEPEDPKVVGYLQKNLRSSKIDPQNHEHIRFLEGKVPLLQSEAQRVLDGKVPKWWCVNQT